MFAEIGENCYIEPPLHANWGGHHVHFGKGVYANFNLTLVDDTHIFVGDYTMLGPNVVLATAGIEGIVVFEYCLKTVPQRKPISTAQNATTPQAIAICDKTQSTNAKAISTADTTSRFLSGFIIAAIK